MTTETERVGQRRVHLNFASCVGHVIEVTIGVWKFIVGGRRDDAVQDCHDTNSGLDCPGTADEMAGHGLRRAYRHLVRMPSQHRLDGQRLGGVALGRARPVGVDIVHLPWLEASVRSPSGSARSGF